MGALIEIEEVSVMPPSHGVRAAHLDTPSAEGLVDARAAEFRGWVLGENVSVETVELTLDGVLFERIAVELPRPDLAEKFGESSQLAEAGFESMLDGLALPAEFELRVSAVLHGGASGELWSIRGRRRWRRSASQHHARLASLVISRFAGPPSLEDTVESALAQTHAPIEIVVVDDRSGTASEVADRYEGVRSVPWEGTGRAAARNTGIRRTNGDFLTFLSAGERLLPGAVAVGVRSLDEHPDCAFAAGRERGPADGMPSRMPSRSPMGTAVYRRAVFEELIVSGISLARLGDHELIDRLFREFTGWSHGEEVVEWHLPRTR